MKKNESSVILSGENVHLKCPSICPPKDEIRPKQLPEKISLKLEWDQLHSLDTYLKTLFHILPEPTDLDGILVMVLLQGFHRDKLLKKATYPKPEQKVSLSTAQALALLKVLMKYRPNSLPLGTRIHLDQFTAILHQQLT